MSDSSAIVPAVDGKRSTKVKLLLFGTGRGNIVGRVNNILFSDFVARFLGLGVTLFYSLARMAHLRFYRDSPDSYFFCVTLSKYSCMSRQWKQEETKIDSSRLFLNDWERLTAKQLRHMITNLTRNV